MSLFLTKLAPLFIYPLGAAILLGFLALALTLTQYRRVGSTLLGLTLVALWIASSPVFANWIISLLESQYRAVPVEELPRSDAIILLGGALGQPLPPRVTPDLGEPADRILHALHAYRAEKADYIVISGGNLPWQAAVSPEAELIADLLVELGVPRSALMVEPESRNTHENAVNTAAIFRTKGWRQGLLTTSAAHMPRAVAAFRKARLEVVPAPTDFHVRFPLYDSLLDFLPDADALLRTTSAIKELIGLRIYRIRGWA